jgi:hypothetical protein
MNSNNIFNKFHFIFNDKIKFNIFKNSIDEYKNIIKEPITYVKNTYKLKSRLLDGIVGIYIHDNQYIKPKIYINLKEFNFISRYIKVIIEYNDCSNSNPIYDIHTYKENLIIDVKEMTTGLLEWNYKIVDYIEVIKLKVIKF